MPCTPTSILAPKAVPKAGPKAKAKAKGKAEVKAKAMPASALVFDEMLYRHISVIQGESVMSCGCRAAAGLPPGVWRIITSYIGKSALSLEISDLATECVTDSRIFDYGMNALFRGIVQLSKLRADAVRYQGEEEAADVFLLLDRHEPAAGRGEEDGARPVALAMPQRPFVPGLGKSRSAWLWTDAGVARIVDREVDLTVRPVLF